MKILILLFGLSWLDGGHLTPITKPRPTPIEPDKPNNDFREPVKPRIEPDKPNHDFHATKPTWHADQNGYWWVQGTTQRFGDVNPDVVRPYGYPINVN